MDFIVESIYQQCLKTLDNEQRLNLASMLLESVKVECFSLIQEEQLKNDFITIPDKEENGSSHNDSFPENISLNQPQEAQFEDETREAPKYDTDEGKFNYILENLKEVFVEQLYYEEDLDLESKISFKQLRKSSSNSYPPQFFTTTTDSFSLDFPVGVNDFDISYWFEALELLMAIEEKFDCKIPEIEAEKITTIRDLVEYIMEQI